MRESKFAGKEANVCLIFLPRDAMLARYMLSSCLSVRHSVRKRKRKQRHTNAQGH